MGGRFDQAATYGKDDRPSARVGFIHMARVSLNTLGGVESASATTVAIMINRDGPNVGTDAPTNADAIVFHDAETLDSFIRNLRSLRRRVWGKA